MQKTWLQGAKLKWSRSPLFRLGCCLVIAGLAGCGAGDGIEGIDPPAEDPSIQADALTEFTYSDDFRVSRERLVSDWSARFEAIMSGADTNFEGGLDGIGAATYAASLYRFYLGDHYSGIADMTHRTVAAVSLQPTFVYGVLLEEKAALLAIFDTDVLPRFPAVAPRSLADLREQVVREIDEYSVMIWDIFDYPAEGPATVASDLSFGGVATEPQDR